MIVVDNGALFNRDVILTSHGEYEDDGETILSSPLAFSTNIKMKNDSLETTYFLFQLFSTCI